MRDKEIETQRNKTMESLELLQSDIIYVKNGLAKTSQKMDALEAANNKENTGMGRTMERIEEHIQLLTERVEKVDKGLENVQEKMYDFDANKKNNLIVYGI